MKTTLALIALMGLIIIPTGCVTAPRGFPATGGIQNFDLIDAKLARGAQFNHSGLDWLVTNFHDVQNSKPLTIINLRQVHESWTDEEPLCNGHLVRYFNVPLNPLSAPAKDDVEKIIKIINDAPGIVFIHCQFGCDRTGTAVACYRIRLGMANQNALNDAKQHGMSAFEVGMMEFIKHFK